MKKLAKKLGKRPEEIKTMILMKNSTYSANKKFILKQKTYKFDTKLMVDINDEPSSGTYEDDVSDLGTDESMIDYQHKLEQPPEDDP